MTSKNKFETTLEYYQHLYKIEQVDEEECLRIFNENDIKIIPRERIKFYYVNDVEQHYNDKNTDTTNTTYDVEEIEEDTIKESKHILRKIEGNIPIMFRKNTKYNYIDDNIDNDNEILYDILSGEENDSDSEESEELI